MKQKKLLMLIAMVLVVVLCASVLTACKKDKDKGNKDAKVYTYRMGPADLPTSWNYHTYQSNSSTYILDYASDALYTFDYNDDLSGYKIVPSMAAGDPVDVTAEYVGKYGITESMKNKVYAIPLKTNLKFDNGDVINANTFVESMKLLLDPTAKNFRADNTYKSGDLKIFNAEQYVKQNTYGTGESFFVANGLNPNKVKETYIPVDKFDYDEDGYLMHNGKNVVLDINNGDNWGSSLSQNADDMVTGYETDEATGRYKIFDKDGKWILTRSIEKDAEVKDFLFYDLDGNKLPQRYVNEAGNAWVYLDKNGNIVEAWAGCKPKSLSSCYDPIVAAANEFGVVKLTKSLLKNLQDCIAMNHGYSSVEEYAAPKGEYAELLVKYYVALNTEKNAKSLKEAWDKLTDEDKAKLVSVEYKVYDAEKKIWTDKTGVKNADEYVEYNVYVTADNYATADSQPNDYAYVEFEEMVFYGMYYGSLEFSEVGFFAKDDNTLCVVLKNAMEDNFYLRYELCTSFFLVNPALYKQCITNSGGVYNNKYGTSVDTFVGYGPYKLTQYVADSTIVLEKNPLWHGFSADEYKAGTYQTDRVVYTLVKDDALRLEMFLKGELDSYGLQAKDMSDYIASDYIYYTDSESTWYLAMNPDFNNLKTLQETAKSETGKKVVKTVLSIQEFRQALSYSLDREQFNLRLSPTSGIAKGLLSAMIVADPESGRTYRSLDEAKDAILEFWGLSDHWGEGKEYATRDDAIASITGYDPAGAKTLFRTAYSKAVKEGMLTEGDDNWVVQIVIGIPVTADFYTDGAEFLATNWKNAVKDTPFEGHLEFVNSQELGGTTFGEYLRNGQVDLLFGVGYAGSMFNPYSMMDCFTGSLQYDVFTDKKTKMMDVTYDFGEGKKTYRASLYDWVSECLQGNKIKAYVVDAEGNTGKEYIEISAGSSDPAARRIAILARAETEIMRLSNIFPVQTDSTAALKGMRINYKTEDYVVGMGRGGIQYYTYSMSDAEFADYVKKQGGVLNYK